MRALRERPRATVAKGAAVLLVFLLGMAVAGLISDSGEDVPGSTQQALERAQRAAQTNEDRLSDEGEQVKRLEARVTRLERRLRASTTRNRRLRVTLRRARRQLSALQP